ncbi:hypothetical protein SmJEL517_g04056 [Synchytrium microbalum]|uniref:Uncharacterized protein n=1 Tax=Synchytrium microbalum TaxID=1806994 RepID=A0A507BVE9_9FUNG|nr:uncharacterized protein SmJEL517_g04056 [Synchytrium microbalum]TPX32867.1 hypothetical protein SmJEL517_g04056 [Synchytrium microbalum]
MDYGGSRHWQQQYEQPMYTHQQKQQHYNILPPISASREDLRLHQHQPTLGINRTQPALSYLAQYEPVFQPAPRNQPAKQYVDSYSARYADRKATYELSDTSVLPPVKTGIPSASTKKKVKRRDGWFDASMDSRGQEIERIKGLVRAHGIDERFGNGSDGLSGPQMYVQEPQMYVQEYQQQQQQAEQKAILVPDVAVAAEGVHQQTQAQAKADVVKTDGKREKSARDREKDTAEKQLEAEKAKTSKLASRIRKLEKQQEKLSGVLQKLCNLESNDRLNTLTPAVRASHTVARFCKTRGVDDAVEALVFASVIPDSGLTELPEGPTLETLIACWDVAQNVITDVRLLCGIVPQPTPVVEEKAVVEKSKGGNKTPVGVKSPRELHNEYLAESRKEVVDVVRPPAGPAPIVSSASVRSRRRENLSTRTPPASSSARSPPPASESDRRSQPPVASLLDVDPRPVPPPPIQNETSEFVLARKCGPCVGNVRCIDITEIPEENMIVLVTAGESRTMSFWDVLTGSPIMHLDTHTSKPTLTVSFHKTRPQWLMTSDMDGDVKLWDWKRGKIVRIWRKVHTRVIGKCEFCPLDDGGEDRAASCSSDNSLKIWDASEDKPRFTGVNANEPFTSFLFCGDSQAETLVASLSYSIRIYKTRTLILLHTLQLGELRLNKTAVTSLQPHPSDSGFVLISCDSQLRLVDLRTGSSSRALAAREIAPGTRIEARVSPHGTFAYAGGSDMKSFASFSSPSKSSSKTIQQKQTAAFGVFIWRLSNGRLERDDMISMCDDEEAMAPIGQCKWFHRKSDDREDNASKLLVAVGGNGIIYVYS